MLPFRTPFSSSLTRSRAAALLSAAAAIVLTVPAQAAQISNDARSAIPQDVQQIISVDYRAMQNSPAAMSLKDRVMPPELKRLETALVNSGFKVDADTDALAFASFKVPGPDEKAPDQQLTVGIAQGQFHTRDILATFVKNKVKPVAVRHNDVYPMGSTGLSVVFLNPTTMVFGDKVAITAALDARDGLKPNFLQNNEMMNDMISVDQHAVWSMLDTKGSQTMMRGVLGQAAQLADFDVVKNRIKTARYTMDFSNGVKFDMAVVTSDVITAGTCAMLMKGVVLLKKSQGSPLEKTALDSTTVDSSGSTLTVAYSSSDSQFASLLSSPLFQSVVK